MKAIVKEAAKYVGISTGIALGIFCFVGMIFDLYYGGNFSLSGYQFTKMVVGCVVVGWGFGIPAVVYRKENMPMPIQNMTKPIVFLIKAGETPLFCLF